MSDEHPPWYTPGHVASLQGAPCALRPRERLWTLVKRGKRVDADLLFHNEYRVEVQFIHEGVMAYARRWNLRASAIDEADEHQQRLLGEGWRQP